ncbi:hypothetical protein B0H12DRAFT_1230603 [Mycena haematopus]|nr:hypothetical protein B0H12DRAFT_1230603 [Mycena haematopus]
MPRAGTAQRRRERAGLPPVKPGKVSWVHGTKLAFFSAYKDDYLAAAEGIRVQYPPDGDLEEGQDVADDVDPDEDIDSLSAEVAEERSQYFAKLRGKIGVWYNAQYGGAQKKRRGTKTFKQLFDKTELEPPAPVKSRTLHFYSRHFYAERIKPRVVTRWAALSRLSNPPPLINVRNAVTKEAWLAEMPEFRDEVMAAIEKEHDTAVEAYKIALANDVPSTAEEYSVALNNAAFYLQPFAEAARRQFGMNIAILMCGPIPDRGGRIEVRSVHAGFSNGLVPRIWSDFDRAGFDAAQRSFIAFTHKCFTEDECRARATGERTGEDTVSRPDEDASREEPVAPPQPILPRTSPEVPTAVRTTIGDAGENQPAPTGNTFPPAPTVQPTADPLPPSQTSSSTSLVLRPSAGEDDDLDLLLMNGPLGNWENELGDGDLGFGDGGDYWLGDGYTGPVVGEALSLQIAAMPPGEGFAYMGRLGAMSAEDVEKANACAASRVNAGKPAMEQEEQEETVEETLARLARLTTTTTPLVVADGVEAPALAPSLVNPIQAPVGDAAVDAAQGPVPAPLQVDGVAPSLGDAIQAPVVDTVQGPVPVPLRLVVNGVAPSLVDGIQAPVQGPVPEPPRLVVNGVEAPGESVPRARPKPRPAWGRPPAPDEEHAGGNADHEGAKKDQGDESGNREGEENGGRDEDSVQADKGHAKGVTVWDGVDDSRWPEELKMVFNALKRGRSFGGDEWTFCVEQLIALERAWGFPTKGPLSVPAGTKETRPEEIPGFMQRARKWDKKVPLSSAPGPATEKGTFAARWWKWWQRAQPEGRFLTCGRLVSATVLDEEDLIDVGKMVGRNGMLLYVGALLWWGEAVFEVEEGTGPLLEDWKVAVVDVASVLGLAAEAKRDNDNLNAVVDGGENVGGRGAKRRRDDMGAKAAAASTGPEKENEMPKKRRSKTNA